MKNPFVRRLFQFSLVLILTALAVGIFWLRPAAQSVEYHLRRAIFFARLAPTSEAPRDTLERVHRELVAAQPDLESVGALLDVLQVLPLWRVIPDYGERVEAYVHLWQALRYGTRAALAANDLIGEWLDPGADTNTNALTRMLIWIYRHRAWMQRLARDFHRASQELAYLRVEAVPADFRAEWGTHARLVRQADALVQKFAPALDPLLEAAGFNGPRTYLILLQNNLELRPTGGFIGEYAIVEIELGDVVALQFADSYDFPSTGIQRVGALPAPQALSDFYGESTLEFRDLNWSPDFPTSARVAGDYYQREFARTPDGVAAINFSVARDLLTVVGPITIPESEVPLTTENFYERYLTIRATHPEYKQVLASLAREVLARLRQGDAERLNALTHVLEGIFREKDILIWFAAPDLQNLVQRMNWDGAIRASQGDYLLVSDANMSGQKNSTLAANHARAELRFDEWGTLHTTLMITTTNLSPSTQRVFRRIYLPSRAQVESLDLMMIYRDELFGRAQARWENNRVITQTVEDPNRFVFTQLQRHAWTIGDVQSEFDKNVIAFSFLVARPPIETLDPNPGLTLVPVPGGLTVLQITYSVPNAVIQRDGEAEYRLLIQKQPGAMPISFTLDLTLPRDAKLVGNNSTFAQAAPFDLTHDEEIVVRFR